MWEGQNLWSFHNWFVLHILSQTYNLLHGLDLPGLQRYFFFFLFRHLNDYLPLKRVLLLLLSLLADLSYWSFLKSSLSSSRRKHFSNIKFTYFFVNFRSCRIRRLLLLGWLLSFFLSSNFLIIDFTFNPWVLDQLCVRRSIEWFPVLSFNKVFDVTSIQTQGVEILAQRHSFGLDKRCSLRFHRDCILLRRWWTSSHWWRFRVLGSCLTWNMYM